MDNVIEQSKLYNHTIQKYRFKVLGSVKSEDEKEDEYTQKSTPVLDERDIIKGEKIDENQNQFVEELLKRSDTLSSNIVKLQMQIEKQESEFEKRLKDSIAREKEISFSEGYEKAKKELESGFNEKVLNYIESAKKLNEKIKEFDEFFKKIEKSIVDTSLGIANEVIKKEIETSSAQVAIALAKELVDELRDVSKMTLKVNPKDFDALNKVFGDNSKVLIQSDSAISPGGVILLSEKGNLDGNISARLEKVKYLLQSESNN